MHPPCWCVTVERLHFRFLVLLSTVFSSYPHCHSHETTPLHSPISKAHKMFSKTTAKLILAATLGAVFVAAQSSTDTSSAASPSGTGSIDTCILTCVTQAASSAGCSSLLVSYSTIYPVYIFLCLQHSPPGAYSDSKVRNI